MPPQPVEPTVAYILVLGDDTVVKHASEPVANNAKKRTAVGIIVFDLIKEILTISSTKFTVIQM